MTTYPLHVEARLDAPLSRWRWLVKWFLVIPHYVVLAFLWIAFTALSAVAMVTIVATGRYPRSIFEFNVGVLRWTWRVQYYAYGALGTDRYPPFTLDDLPDYPARLSVEYPEHLSRGLALVKWWLLAIPHYVIVALLLGGLLTTHLAGGGVIALLVLVAGLILAFTGSYPTQLFDVVLGLNRWVLRVVAYAGLMTDEYPPFRLDAGGSDPGGTMTLPSPRPPTPPRPWGAGRVLAVVVGALMLTTSLGLFAAGSVAGIADRAGRDSAGYLNGPHATLFTSTYALTLDTLRIEGGRVPEQVVGTVRVRVTPRGEKPVFVGVARSSDVDTYLAGVAHAVVTDWAGDRLRTGTGAAPASPPGERSFWVASSSGPGTQTLRWEPTDGDWTLVAMNADGSPAVAVTAVAGVRAPDLGWLAVGLLAAGAVLLAGGGAVLLAAVRDRS
jgi:hypothetical protein